MSREAMKLALEALEDLIPLCDPGFSVCYDVNKAITALREALAEQPAQQEPVAWMTKTGSVWKTKADETDTPLYTSPPAQRKPLTRDQVKAMMVENGYDQASPQERADFINGLRHGEAAHGIKENT